MTEKAYAIAIKQPAVNAAPTDWKDRLARIEGVTSVSGNLPHRAQFTATPEGAERVRQELASSFYIEPLADRTTP